MNKRFYIVWVMVGLFFALGAEANNVAFQSDCVRFTFISEGAIRLEWSSSGSFTNQRSFLAIERDYPEVPFRSSLEDGILRLSTSRLELTYRVGMDSLSVDNLKITSVPGADVPFVWYPGCVDTLNLKGTYRTLDRCDGDSRFLRRRDPSSAVPLVLEDGLLSRSGWTFLQDANRLLFDDDSELPWVMQRADSTAQDGYFLAYGHDYKQALYDFTLFAGRIPLPPHFAFGFWWSRYWAYTSDDLLQLVQHFKAMNIPLDVLVIDMDWHYSDGIRGGWTGYNWNLDLIPDPEALLNRLHQEGVKVTLNLHPADGIRTWEKTYPAVAQAMGVTDGRDIPWQSSNKLFMQTWMEKVLRPIEKQGVDFWWLDWQQRPNDSIIPNLSNTWWLNYFLFSDFERNRTERPLLYHRWGGLGNHRYQVGFSGDTYTTWKSLAYQPYFNHTASNVLYGYWSHDLGGHMAIDKGKPYDLELYMRWVQFGTFSPIMRIHSTKDTNIVKEPWLLSDTVQRVVGNAIRLRYQLLPYIYSMAYHAYLTGESLCRPLYYDYPEAEEAYERRWRNEYLFGDNLLVAPIAEPMQDGYSHMHIWLPQGKWYDLNTDEMIQGGQVIERDYTIDEYPVFVKAGAVIPIADTENNVVLHGWAGEKSVFVLYEDEGNTQTYPTEHTCTRIENTGTQLYIHSAHGDSFSTIMHGRF